MDLNPGKMEIKLKGDPHERSTSYCRKQAIRAHNPINECNREWLLKRMEQGANTPRMAKTTDDGQFEVGIGLAMTSDSLPEKLSTRHD